MATFSSKNTQLDVTNGAAHVLDQSLRAGEDSDLNARMVIDGFEYTKITADATVKDSAGYVAGYIVTAGAASTLALYDNPTAASGNVIHLAAAVDASATSVIVTFPKPLRFKTGLYADIGGASAAINVIWK